MSLRGYWRTLRPPSPVIEGKRMGRSAFDPAMRITKLTTSARTGRRMKRSVNDFIDLAIPSCVRRFRRFLQLWRELVVDRDRHAVAQFEYAGSDDDLTRLQSGRH